MADFVLKYADSRGQIHQQVASAGSEKELRDKYSQQGFLIYSSKARTAAAAVASSGLFGGRKKLQLEKFLIFNQQFVTLIRAGLPILKSLDLLADRLTDPKLTPFINSVREDVPLPDDRTPLSDLKILFPDPRETVKNRPDIVRQFTEIFGV